ncbi:hypothetical protein MHYP_G00139090 [Metynnis hypsauchen]
MLTVLKRDEAFSPVGIPPSRERPAHLCPPERTAATAAVTASAGNKSAPHSSPHSISCSPASPAQAGKGPLCNTGASAQGKLLSHFYLMT